MKTDKYRNIWCENPWKVFKRGILPIGLAIAYREKHGYDPLKACRLYLWLDQIRGVALQLILGIVVIVITSLPFANKHEIIWQKLLQIPVVQYGIIITAVIALIILCTTKTYRQSQRRMWDFQNATSSFVFAFSSMFEDESSTIKATMGKDELLAEVSKDMTRTAQTIVEGEITGYEAAGERYQLGQKSSIANTFGLGSDWSIFFNKARETINPYELFAWDI